MLGKLDYRQVLILGLGREGLSTYKFFQKNYPQVKLTLADQDKSKKFKAPAGVSFQLGENYLQNLGQYDLIIRTPGIPILPELVKIKNKLSSQTKLFFDLCPALIIGVTGTKGKGTTASLTYHIFKLAGLPVYLAGNIGTPMLPLLEKVTPKDIVILELSSHQLQDLDRSPQYAVLLNIFPEHLDHFKNFQEYQDAKAKITKFQNPKNWFIYNADDPKVRKIALKSKAQKIKISLTHTPHFSHNPLIGRHNLYNLMAAIEVAKLFKIADRNINKALKSFKTLPHRLELVGTFAGITFYNDSQGTNPQAAIAALNSFNNVGTLICGGYNRGGVSYEELGKKIADYGLKTLILFPTTGQIILAAVKNYSKKKLNYFFVTSMEEAVKLGYRHTPKNTICLLSPSSASFGIFKDYADRGNQFKKFVRNLKSAALFDP